MSVNTKTNKFLIKIINGIEMLQKEVTKNEIAVVMTVEWVLSDSKLADSFALMKV